MTRGHRLTGKRAVAIGCAHGFGAASARAMANEGASVIVADIDAEQAERTAKEIAAAGGEASSHWVDVGDEAAGEEQDLAWEGCLSIPGLRGAVPRPARVRYRGVDLEGQVVERTVSGFHARVVQHEFDHLNGILYPMRMEDFALFGFTDEITRAASAAAQAPKAGGRDG